MIPSLKAQTTLCMLGQRGWSESQKCTNKPTTYPQVSITGVSNTRPANCMWPTRAFCAARDAFSEFSNNWHLHCHVPWKQMPRNNWIKADWHPVRFSSRPWYYRPNLTLQQIFEKSWEYAKDVYTCFVYLEKAYDRVPREKVCGVLREHGVDTRLLLAIKSLYSWSAICFRVARVESRTFTVAVGLRQGCVLSPLLFIVYIRPAQFRKLRAKLLTLICCGPQMLYFISMWRFPCSLEHIL